MSKVTVAGGGGGGGGVVSALKDLSTLKWTVVGTHDGEMGGGVTYFPLKNKNCTALILVSCYKGDIGFFSYENTVITELTGSPVVSATVRTEADGSVLVVCYSVAETGYSHHGGRYAIL